jgi:predicted PurR-regulated permease PerM
MATAAAERESPQSWRRLRRTGEAALWLVVIAVAVWIVVQVAARLRLVVLPFGLALLLTTFLSPPAGWLRARGWPSALAAITVLVTALLVLVAIGLLVVPAVVDEFADLDVGLSGAVDDVREWILDLPLPLPADQVSEGIARVQDGLGDSASRFVSPLVSGAMVAVEVATGLVLAVVTTFFLLKDGDRIWAWVVSLLPPRRREDGRAIGERAWQALGGFMRGQTVVALFDAVFIGLGLVIMGVPLALPLAVLTFFGAYIPIIGATVTGGLAVLMALVTDGVVAAAVVLGIVIAVQQLEGNVLQPAVVGRAIDVHPLAILFGVTAGGVLAGIIGAMIAAPLIAVGGAVLGYLRERSDAQGDDGGVGDEDAGAEPG